MLHLSLDWLAVECNISGLQCLELHFIQKTHTDYSPSFGKPKRICILVVFKGTVQRDFGPPFFHCSNLLGQLTNG